MWSRQQILKCKRNIHLAATSLPDDAVAETPEILVSWEVGTTYFLNDRFQYEGKAYKCEQPQIVASSDYPPGVAGTESLYSEIAKPGDGTHDNPIKYNNNMGLSEGLYYTQVSVLYLCIRSSGIPVYNNLSDLVGLYVEVSE